MERAAKRSSSVTRTPSGSATRSARAGKRWPRARPRGPVGSAILLDVHLEHWFRNARGSAGLRVELLRPREKEKRAGARLAANADGLFDVSDLVL